MVTESDASQKMLSSLVQVVNSIVNLHDPTAAGHQCDVALLARAIAEEMHNERKVVDCVFLAGQIHDIGKIAIPSEILAFPGKLDDIQQMVVMCHPEVGYEILKPIEFPWPVADTVHQHHERLNGSGYPNGLTGDQMRLESKILAVADVVQAMYSNRSYHPPLGIENVVRELEEHKGTLYDAEVVDCYKRIAIRTGTGLTRFGKSSPHN
jgi:putative nucleotidyltransferase with HDIG domain